ncbi:MAG: Crp/Fnr family transcriptional regulator [Hyphomicrobiaceae bacterium]|nr:Crp/Fnr family transcriptional regulator [Hyphomicrobiaceae bacterium]
MTADIVFDFSRLDLPGAAPRLFAGDERIFLEGEAGSTMYLVRSGKVAIKAGGMIVDNIGPGGIFGEMSLIDGSPRSATAYAAEASEVAVIDKPTFLALVRHDPNFALLLMRMLAHRLRRTTESL